MVVNHSVKLSFDLSLRASAWKIVHRENLNGTPQNAAWNGFAYKKLYNNKSLSSRIFFGWRGNLPALKTVGQNNPIFARRKTDLKRGFVTKKVYTYKAPLWLVLQTARVGSRRAFFLRGTSEHTTPLRNPVMLHLSPQREYTVL